MYKILFLGLLVSFIGIIYQVLFLHHINAVEYFSPYTLKQVSQYEFIDNENITKKLISQQWNSCKNSSFVANRYCFVEMNNTNSNFHYKLYLDPYNNIYSVIDDEKISKIYSENTLFYTVMLFNPIEKMPTVIDPICETSKKREFLFGEMRETIVTECSAIYKDILDKNTSKPNTIRIKYKFAQNLGLVSYHYVNHYLLKLIGIKDD